VKEELDELAAAEPERKVAVDRAARVPRLVRCQIGLFRRAQDEKKQSENGRGGQGEPSAPPGDDPGRGGRRLLEGDDERGGEGAGPSCLALLHLRRELGGFYERSLDERRSNRFHRAFAARGRGQ
jgi:hypothetical protein